MWPILQAFLTAIISEEASAKATDLMECLDIKCRQRWEDTVQGIDFTHSSRVAWKTFNRLTGRSSHPKSCPVTANSIAHQLLANGNIKEADKKHDLSVKQESSKLWSAPGVDGLLSAPFPSKSSPRLLTKSKVVKHSPDNIPPEFLKHYGPKCLAWFKKFYSASLSHQSILKIWQ